MAEVEGLAELSFKLGELGKKLGSKALRQAALQVTTPVFKEMKAAIPVGKVSHKTYKGRLVAPGFAKRSIKRKSSIKNGKATVVIGVRREAFYAVSFVDKGTVKMTAQSWFKQNFIDRQRTMQDEFANILKDKIRKVAR